MNHIHFLTKGSEVSVKRNRLKQTRQFKSNSIKTMFQFRRTLLALALVAAVSHAAVLEDAQMENMEATSVEVLDQGIEIS